MFIVADSNLQPVLSATTCKKHNLIKHIFQIDANVLVHLKNIKTVTVYSALIKISTTSQLTLLFLQWSPLRGNSLCNPRQTKIWTQQNEKNGNQQVSQRSYRMVELTSDYGETQWVPIDLAQPQ